MSSRKANAKLFKAQRNAAKYVDHDLLLGQLLDLLVNATVQDQLFEGFVCWNNSMKKCMIRLKDTIEWCTQSILILTLVLVQCHGNPLLSWQVFIVLFIKLQ